MLEVLTIDWDSPLLLRIKLEGPAVTLSFLGILIDTRGESRILNEVVHPNVQLS